VAIVPFQSLADISCRGIVERHVQCAQSPMHLAESAAPSGNSRLHSSIRKHRLINNFNYCLQKHYH